MPPVKWLKIATKHHPVGTRKFTSILRPLNPKEHSVPPIIASKFTSLLSETRISHLLFSNRQHPLSSAPQLMNSSKCYIEKIDVIVEELSHLSTT